MSSLTDEDRMLIGESVDKFIEAHYVPEARVELLEAASPWGEHWGTFADLGWLSMPFDVELGGLGGGVADVQVLMRAFGRGLILEPYVEVALAGGKALEACAASARAVELLGALMAGSTRVVLAHGEALAEPGYERVSCRAETAAGGFRLTGAKPAVWQAGAADRFLVSALLEDQPALLCVDCGAEGLRLEAFRTIDSRRAGDLYLAGAFVAEENLLARGEQAIAAIRQALLFTYAALIGEVSGICDQLVAITAGYMNTREQFGSRLAGFQALQHKLADMVIAAEEVKSLEWLVAGASELDDTGEAEKVIRSARARVCRVSRALGESAVQLHGGVGVSDELIVSHYLRRLVAIDAFYGDAAQQLAWLAGQD